MPRPVACPQCREELDIPAEFRGEPVRCASCGTTFTPPADEPAPRRRPDPDDAPRRRVPAQRSSHLGLWLAFAGVFGICTLGCAGLIVLAIVVDMPHLEPYTSPDGRFRAAFPNPPTATTRDGLNGGEPTTAIESTREVIGDQTDLYFVHHTDLPNKPRKPAEFLEEAANRFATRTPGTTVASRTNVTVSGVPAVQMQLQHPDESQTFVQILLADDRLYQVGVTGVALEPTSQRVIQFWNAFKLTAADPGGGPVPPLRKGRGRPPVQAADEE